MLRRARTAADRLAARWLLRAPRLFAVAPLFLAGLMPLHDGAAERWPIAGAWIFPVGERYEAPCAPAAASSGAFRVTRNVTESGAAGGAHTGADLSCGRAGDVVRAAAAGLVVAAGPTGWNSGYGRHVVIAHHLPDGTLVYSVYAHLGAGATRARVGQRVGAGERLGNVGMSGRATSPHLHFEIRIPTEPGVRWENTPPVDPLAFVAARIPGHRADSSWSGRYLEWAECAGAIGRDEASDEPVLRAAWWRMLAAATRTPDPALDPNPESLRASLIAFGVLPPGAPARPDDAVAWTEIARDLKRARSHSLRLPYAPVARAARRAERSRLLGIAPGGNPLEDLGRRVRRPPSIALACLTLADLAGDAKGRIPSRASRSKPRPTAGSDSTTARR